MISKQFDRNVYILNISQIKNDNDFLIYTSKIKNNSIILMEDIDCVESCLDRKYIKMMINKETKLICQ